MKPTKRQRTPKAIKRTRTLLAIPKTPGGHLDYPPIECPHVKDYCPDPARYETARVVDYVICSFSCKQAKGCYRKDEADEGTRKRIRQTKNGIEEE